MKPKFDVRCDNCNHVFEEEKKFNEPASCCPECGSGYTRTILSGFNTTREVAPYDLLDRPIRTKPIKSFANDKRKRR